jgi:predicted flap endonuclease-1-like 5' DNA nuclease
MDYPISEIEGIDKKYKAKLGGAGISTTDELLEKCRTPGDRDKLAEETGIGSGLLLKWAERADLMRIKGVGGEFSDVLAAAGTGSVKELAAANAEELHAALDNVIKKKKLVKQLPSVNVITKWVVNAREMVEATAGDRDGVLAEEERVEGEEPREYEPGDVDTDKCAETWFRKLESFVRNNYFLGKLMTARDMEAEQEYVRRNFALGRRTIAGWGKICGLEVSEVKLKNTAITFKVSPGLAVDRFGRFIVVGPPKEPEEAAETLPECEPGKGPEHSIDVSAYAEKFEGDGRLFLDLYIYYDEEEYELVPTFKRDEPCEEDLMPNRVRETYGFTVSATRLKWVEPVLAESEVLKPAPEPVSERTKRVFGRGETGCPEPIHKCVFLAKLICKKQDGVWKFVWKNAERAIYSNVELYALITANLSEHKDFVKKINEAVPDGDGKIALSGGQGMGIAKVGNNALSVSLAGADKYVKRIKVVGGDTAGAVRNEVRFAGKNGIKIKTFETDGVKNGLTFTLDKGVPGLEYNIVTGEIPIKLERGDARTPYEGDGAITISELKMENIAAVDLAYSCPGDSENAERIYLGEPELLNGEIKVHMQLAGWLDRAEDSRGRPKPKGVKLQVYLRSKSRIKQASVHYAIIERVKR